MDFRRILASDTELHSPFFEFVGVNFRGTNAECWQLWHDHGGWTKDYEVFAAIDGKRIVSTIGRTQMKLALGGKLQTGFQLGAVATLEPYRKQGIARQLMARVIDALDDPEQPLILFANKSVVDFYPRFGFRRVPQRQSTAMVAIQPANTLATQCDPSSTIDQQRMADLCARAQPIAKFHQDGQQISCKAATEFH